MKFGSRPLTQSIGAILAHQLVGADGHKLLSKGHVLTEVDCQRLTDLGIESLVVVLLDEDDLDENAAARRVGAALVGDGVRLTAPGVGRANLMADVRGVLRINVPVLERLNNIDEGITIATLREHVLVQAGQQIGLVKIIPYAMPLARIEDIEATAQQAGQIMAIRPLRARSVGLIVTGPDSVRAKLLKEFTDPVRQRVEGLGSQLAEVVYTGHDEDEIAEALIAQQTAGRDLILVAGVSATIDRHDVIPAALRLAKGSVAHFGVPVDPGSLLMLGYIGQTAVIGAPGCVKSMKTNVIDLILPRLFAGERLTRADLVALGHGGLLEDVPERPMPRDEAS